MREEVEDALSVHLSDLHHLVGMGSKEYSDGIEICSRTRCIAREILDPISLSNGNFFDLVCH